jgi:uncharacterized membrane protein YdbT with pleckstrin-like domain
MVDEDDAADGENSPLEGHASVSIAAGAATLTAGDTVGAQQLAYADVQIRIETAAHQREIETKRLERELEHDRLEQHEKLTERRHQRLRENASYCVITALVVGGLIASFYFAVSTADATTRTWAQGIVTTLAGGAAGAFFG